MKNFLLAHWRGGCAASRIAGQTRHPRDPGANEDERASQRPFDGNPHTRLAGANRGCFFIWDKDVFVSRPAAAIARPAGVSRCHSGKKRARLMNRLPAEDGPASIESSWSVFLGDYPLFDGPSSSPGSVWRGTFSEGSQEAPQPGAETVRPRRLLETSMAFDYRLPAELFVGKRKSRARQQLGYRRFATAAEAIRFAVEDFPAVRTLGAWMQVGDDRFDSEDIHRLYQRGDYPLPRRAT
jgi:hypothetical protein